LHERAVKGSKEPNLICDVWMSSSGRTTMRPGRWHESASRRRNAGRMDPRRNWSRWRPRSRAMKLDFGGVNVDEAGTTDSQPFKAAGMPVLSWKDYACTLP
jgi:hypothetical protein